MAEVELIALVFVGAGQITCRRCGEVSHVNAGSAFLWGRSETTRIETVEEGLIHECGREVEWWCDTCLHGTEGLLMGHGWNKRLVCVTCRGEMRQRFVRKRPTE